MVGISIWTHRALKFRVMFKITVRFAVRFRDKDRVRELYLGLGKGFPIGDQWRAADERTSFQCLPILVYKSVKKLT